MPKRKERKSTRPDGYLAAGIAVPVELTCEQKQYAEKAVHDARFVYNWAVGAHEFLRDNCTPWPSAYDLERAFNAFKEEDYSFVTESSSRVAIGAFNDFKRALKNWRNSEHPAGPPVIKKRKGTDAGGFLASMGVDRCQYDGNRRIKVSRMGSVKLACKLPEGTIPYEVRLTYRNGQWIAGIACWKPPVQRPDRDNQAVGGVDVGISPLAVDTNGDTFTETANPKAYDKLLRKMSRLQRRQRRCAKKPGYENGKWQRGSRSWRKAQKGLDKINRRVVGVRNNAHHHLSKRLVMEYHTLGIETLNVKGMILAGLQSKALSDAAMGGLLEKIRYKTDWYGTTLVEASQRFPSSKTCSACGEVNSSLERQPSWACPACGVVHDRNENAAANLRNLAVVALGRVAPDVTPEDMAALATDSLGGETAVDEAGTGPAAF